MKNIQKEDLYFKNLDSLRFIAFMGVFLSHTFHWQADGALADFFRSIFMLNYLAVPFFFTLSSFLITYNLLSEKKNNGNIFLFRFYINRGLRIWPIYFLMIFLYFVVLPLASSFLGITSPTLPSPIPFLFFFANFYIIEHGINFSVILLILWSISVEEQFYFFWGIVFKKVKINWFIYVLLSLLFFSIVFSYHYLRVSGNNVVIHTFYIIQNFFPGALLAWLFLTQEKSFLQISKIPSSYILLVYLFLPMSYLFLAKDIILLNIIKSTCYGIIIYDQAFNSKRILNLGKPQIINYLGKISYGLYIYHALVMVLLGKLFHFYSKESHQYFFQAFIEVLITFLITVIIAHFSYQFIELKFLSLKIKKAANIIKN